MKERVYISTYCSKLLQLLQLQKRNLPKAVPKNIKQKLLSGLKKIDWDTLFLIVNNICIYHIAKKFLDKITKLVNICTPVKKLSHNERKVYLNLGRPKSYFNPKSINALGRNQIILWFVSVLP